MSAGRTHAVPLAVRDLGPDDLAEVLRIDAEHAGAQAAGGRAAMIRACLAGKPDGARCLLGVPAGGGLAGFLLGEVRTFEFGSEPCGWVHAIGANRRGPCAEVIRALLEEAAIRFGAAGVRRVRTMVRRNDVPVLSFFRDNGFVGGPFVQLERPPGREG